MKGGVGSGRLSVKSRKDDEFYLVVDNVYTWGGHADGKMDCEIENKDYDLAGGRGAAWTGPDAGSGGRLVYAEASGEEREGTGGTKELEWDAELDYGFVFTNWILPVVGVLMMVGCGWTTCIVRCLRGCCSSPRGCCRGCCKDCCRDEAEVVEGLLQEQRRLAAVAPGHTEEDVDVGLDVESQVLATAVVVEPSAPPVAHVVK